MPNPLPNVQAGVDRPYPVNMTFAEKLKESKIRTSNSSQPSSFGNEQSFIVKTENRNKFHRKGMNYLS